MLLKDVELDLFTNDEQASERQNPGGIQLGRLPDAEGRPEDLKGLLKGWLQQCKVSHKCGDSSLRGEGEHRELPGRLIDTSEFWPGTSSRISLALGRNVGPSAAYAALSHRWPEGQPTDHEWTTKTSNIDARRRGFDARTLPATVQDAITIARQLGIRYLWADSVCILQDSAEDWRVESSKMSSVYGDAEVTLFADCAENDYGTFLKPRDQGRFQSRRGSPLGVLDVSHRQIKSTIAERYSRYRPEKPAMAIDTFLSDTIQSHLSTRAWIYQEQVVSRRRIHFGRHQVYWSCGELCEAEDGTDLRPSLPGWYKWLSSPRRGLTAGPNPNERVSDAKEELWLQHRNWAMLLENYTARSLTRSSDKHVAVAAVAERFGKIFDDVYKVGCWERCFRLNLLWAARPTKEPGYRMDPRNMQLPSWSWLSADETIEYPHLRVSRTTRTEQTGLMHVYFLVLKTPEIINGASGPFSSIPIFCETIEVQGLLEPATCSGRGGLGLHGQAPHWHHQTRQHPGQPEQSPYVLLYGGADMERIIGSMIPDRRGGVPLGEVMLLKTTEVEGSTPCSCCQIYKTNYVHFLVLEQDVDDENRFYRVGFGWTYVRHDQSMGLRDAEIHDGAGLWEGEPRVFELA
ncbi:hypothetical protein MAPG_10685 [Magnaporthiopsis poae ATCC 64411]|uniref:Heterokaryon incompatibility domain-containing protein n=1 Tax=Magnaporthiopsis poae (strain ATCC 64411 / 73-15) TaxID=644358 RepID=A0A0C4ED91_MAGP6|nr:hypothetical protein MAPG_10685 [Magnaporthiopsis poae ATCC 64411]